MERRNRNVTIHVSSSDAEGTESPSTQTFDFDNTITKNSIVFETLDRSEETSILSTSKSSESPDCSSMNQKERFSSGTSPKHAGSYAVFFVSTENPKHIRSILPNGSDIIMCDRDSLDSFMKTPCFVFYGNLMPACTKTDLFQVLEKYSNTDSVVCLDTKDFHHSGSTKAYFIGKDAYNISSSSSSSPTSSTTCNTCNGGHSSHSSNTISLPAGKDVKDIIMWHKTLFVQEQQKLKQRNSCDGKGSGGGVILLFLLFALFLIILLFIAIGRNNRQ